MFIIRMLAEPVLLEIEGIGFPIHLLVTGLSGNPKKSSGTKIL